MNPEFPPLPPRPNDASKSTMGSVWIVGGSPGLSGAALLAVHAALRGGCGRATVAVPDSCAGAAEEQKPLEAMCWSPGDESSHWNQSAIDKLMATTQPSSWVIGCGIGREAQTTAALGRFLESASAPTVIDADGLWHLCQDRDLLRQLDPNTILTPHEGELDRLREALDLEATSREDLAARVHQITGAVVVAKGAGTITTGNSGSYRNESGNPGMATAGSGDVLAGLIGSLLARGDTPEIAARRGVWLHGRAGDVAAQQQGEESLIAGDIIAALGKTLLEHCQELDEKQQES